MENSELQEQIINLGKLFVQELKLDPGVDTFSKWMAHYIAEKMKVAEQALSDEDKKEAEKECFETILALWKHRWSLPSRKRPSEEFEPILKTLERLNPDAKEIFARIDYALKNGKHIQRWQQQEDMFRFLERHFVSMQLYYTDFFGVSLETGGESIDKYYYLEFRPDSRGGIPNHNRHFLPNEHVIIGFMLHKILYIDGMIEVNTLPALQRTIRQEYEDIKPGIYRALAKAKKI